MRPVTAVGSCTRETLGDADAQGKRKTDKSEVPRVPSGRVPAWTRPPARPAQTVASVEIGEGCAAS